MYSRKESNLTESPHVDLGDEDSVELVDEARHGDGDTPTKDIGVKGKRKNSSEVHPHFVEIDGLYRGKMVKKKCIHCKHIYVANTSVTASSLKRHLDDCALFQRLKDTYSNKTCEKVVA
ncbi:hypothetical protein L1987_15500 [Smallanthus sonchifolius]|uniref:Uncharacterized protein n=1 Tax=Smallanthus sonchifolius TaxID=185202 RepID=A0ACB9J7A0_9ASTR|nr:hypothetical protein L1987_15500 [Smallanthus sonchifolius]